MKYILIVVLVLTLFGCKEREVEIYTDYEKNVETLILKDIFQYQEDVKRVIEEYESKGYKLKQLNSYENVKIITFERDLCDKDMEM